MTFDDLDFKPHPNWPDGVQAKAEFPNGYGVSVIKSVNSYGGSRGLYELAVFKDGRLCYDTPITGDVLGYLSPSTVTETLEAVEALSPAGE